MKPTEPLIVLPEGADDHCEGQHHYFLVDTFALVDEGILFLVAMCTACGNAIMHKLPIAKGAILPLAATQTKKE